MQAQFGAGILWGTPLTDATGAAIANPSPIQFGALQEVSLDISFDVKELFGSNQFPLAIGRGKGKITGKAKMADIKGKQWSDIVFGQTLAAGIVGDVYDTTGAAIPATPYQITPTVPNSGTWSADLGVRNSAGLPMTRVSAAPATGQYSVAAGVYTFAAADTGTTVYISYQYTATSTSAKKSTIANVPMGYAPTFKCDLYMPYAGKQLVLTLNACTSTKLSLPTKLDDFTITEFDFSAFADSSGNLLTYSTTE